MMSSATAADSISPVLSADQAITTVDRRTTSSPSFFQYLTEPNFTQYLSVPTHYGEKHSEILMTGKVKLRVSSGETWEVKVEKMEEDESLYQFTEGWTKFVQDLKLERNDFLLFLFSGQQTYDVSAHGSNGRGKKCFDNLHRPNYRLIDDNSSSDDDDDDDDDDAPAARSVAAYNSNPKFEKLLGKHHTSRVSIRKCFATGAGLFGKKTVTLEYRPTGFRTEVALDFRSKNMRLNLRGFRLDLATGWRWFRKTNKLRFGNTYCFEFVPSKNVIEVKLKAGK